MYNVEPRENSVTCKLYFFNGLLNSKESQCFHMNNVNKHDDENLASKRHTRSLY